MSKQKNTPSSTAAGAAEVDWAEKLKASITRTPTETASAALYEDDDLAALLREQLGKSAAATAVAAAPDTAEFEDFEDFDEEEKSEEEDPTESFDDESEEEYVEYEEDESDLEYEDEYAEDEESFKDLEDVEEESSERNMKEEELDDREEHVNKGSLDYKEPDGDDDEDDLYGDDGEYEFHKGPVEPKEYIKDSDAEDYDDFIRIPEPVPPVPPPPSASVIRPAYRRPINDPWTDDRLNGTNPREGTGGTRLQELALKNRRLVEEVQAIPYETPGAPASAAASPAAPLTSAPTDSPKNGAESPAAPRPSVKMYVPLQLGLDDISPTVKHRSAKLPTAPASSVGEQEPPEDYAARVADKPAEQTAMQDTDLYLHLGYGETLRRSDEQMRVEQLATEADEGHPPRTSGEYPSVKFDREYRGIEDSDTVEEAYLNARRKNVARLVVAAMGALVGILYDLLPALLAPVSRLTAADAPLYAPLGLVWTILISLPFLPRLGRGLKSLLDFEPTRYTVSAMALVVTLIHGIVACAVGNPYELPLFGGAALLMLTVAALSELLVTEGEHQAFSVVSSGKTAHVPADGPTPAASALPGSQKREPRRKVFTVVRAGRVADYFARTNRYNPYMGRLNYLLPAALLSAIVCAGLEAALSGEPTAASLRVFTAAYLTCLPSAYLLAMTLPLCTANRYLAGKGTAVLGTAAPTDYAVSEHPRLIFSDGDGLRALYRKDITLRGDTDTETYRRMADAVFRLLNTPLAVDPVLREEGTDHYRIEISETDEQYLRLYLVDTGTDSATEVMMGSHSALTRRGIRLPKISMEQRYKKSEGSHVLYLAFNRQFHLAYAVEYRVGRTFGRAVAALCDLGCEVSLASYDPLVGPETEGISRLRKKTPLEILRPVGHEAVRRSRSAGMIATGRSLDLLLPLNACRAMLSAYKGAHLLQWLGLPVAVALPVLAVCLDGVGLLTSAAVALWQTLMLGATLWVTLATAGGRALARDPQKKPQGKESKPEQESAPAE